MNSPEQNRLLGGISPREFLQQHWQKKPRLIRQAWPTICAPITAEELAGLACEQHVDSRLVSNKNEIYTLKEGPLTEQQFNELPEQHWSLLVSDTEKWLPELSFLLQPFDFLPAWRIDDLMISYATDGGGVGPHVDEYDVFLLQLSGQREWQIGKHTDNKELRTDCELAVLKHFSAEQSWTLEPGDMLYLPPGVPHHGVAIGDCMTASIGFRAPLVNNLASDYASYLTEHSATRYTDTDQQPEQHSYELSAQALTRIKEQISKLYVDDNYLAAWAGEYLTSAEQVDAPTDPISQSEFSQNLSNGISLSKNSWSKLLYHHNANQLTLFADAVSYSVDIDLIHQVQIICSRPEFTLVDLKTSNETLIVLLHQLYQQGSLILEISS